MAKTITDERFRNRSLKWKRQRKEAEEAVLRAIDGVEPLQKRSYWHTSAIESLKMRNVIEEIEDGVLRRIVPAE